MSYSDARSCAQRDGGGGTSRPPAPAATAAALIKLSKTINTDMFGVLKKQWSYYVQRIREYYTVIEEVRDLAKSRRHLRRKRRAFAPCETQEAQRLDRDLEKSNARLKKLLARKTMLDSERSDLYWLNLVTWL